MNFAATSFFYFIVTVVKQSCLLVLCIVVSELSSYLFFSPLVFRAVAVERTDPKVASDTLLVCPDFCHR